MICEYCKLIHSTSEQYPLREAKHDPESDYPRCDWHWRYVCDICGQPRHFNSVTWCEDTRKFVCRACGEDHRLVTDKFWKWDSYYAIKCPFCHQRHPAIDRLEFQGNHPWQLHSEMLRSKKNMSLEEECPDTIVSESLPQDHAVSDHAVGKAWSTAADQWWGHYSDFGDTNRHYIIDPAIMSILGDVKGKQVLDAGCGNGYLCRFLWKRGARLTGVDVSEKAIDLAKSAESEEAKGIEYHVLSLSDLSIFKKNTFDFVVSNIVLCDLQDLKRAISEIHRVLKTNGKLVFSIMHPCFSSPPVRGWVKRPLDSGRLEDWIYWKVDRYFERNTEMWKQGNLPALYSFHRPLSDYMKTLIENKFIITDFEEPVPLKKDIEENYRSLCDGERIAWFLVIGAIKMG